MKTLLLTTVMVLIIAIPLTLFVMQTAARVGQLLGMP